MQLSTRGGKGHLYRTGVFVQDFARTTMIVYVTFFSLVFTMRGHLRKGDVAEKATSWTR